MFLVAVFPSALFAGLILLVPESHTRNIYYLESLAALGEERQLNSGQRELVAQFGIGAAQFLRDAVERGVDGGRNLGPGAADLSGDGIEDFGKILSTDRRGAAGCRRVTRCPQRFGGQDVAASIDRPRDPLRPVRGGSQPNRGTPRAGRAPARDARGPARRTAA